MPTSGVSGARGASVWMIVLGLLALVLGAVGMFMIPGLTLAGVIWYGALFIVLGIGLVIESLIHKPRRWGHAILGLVYLVAGAVIAFQPFGAAVAMTLLIGASLVAVGVMRAVWALSAPGMARWLGLLGGIASVVLGVMILARWPSSSIWVVGLFIAVDLIFYGATALALGFGLRKAVTTG